MKLVIVESPTKTKTIGRYLGKDFKLAATLGHIRDLPPHKFGVDTDGFVPTYKVLPGKRKVVKNLKDLKKKAEKVILATDLDREGEAIGWHVKEVLGLADYERIVFHEITKDALKEALASPRKLDLDLVDAQKARRILDRIVGYKLSPLLWKKVAKGLSAGRVQSVVLKLICAREEEIEAFVPTEYWSIIALLKKGRESFGAKLRKRNGKRIKRFEIKNKGEAQKIVEDIKGKKFVVKEVEKRQAKKNPFPPFTTSSLQQDGWYRLHFSSKYTNYLAQALYEKGFITYHRTDSLALSNLSLAKAEEVVTKDFGKDYHPGKPRRFKTKSKSAQEAHEAIRPTYPARRPKEAKKKLDKNQARLYELIWSRFIASQMKPAVFERQKADIKAGGYLFRAKGQALKFDGFLAAYPVRHKEEEIPFLKKGEELDLQKLEPKQHFTRPPARYTEASLIKEMKKNGIGRPSTYAPTVSVIQERNYVRKNSKKRFYPTDLGKTVNKILVEHFPKIVDVDFTAQMEESLDKVAEGKKAWDKLLNEFYKPFKENLDKKYNEIKKRVTETNKKCPKCGSPLVVRMSKYGKFYGCSNFPDCKYTKPIEKKSGVKCPKCKKGDIIEKRSKKGKVFYGCNRWPDCDFALWNKPTGEKCPECESLLVEGKRGSLKCSNKDCDFEK